MAAGTRRDVKASALIRRATRQDIASIHRLVDSYRFRIEDGKPSGFLLPLEVTEIEELVDHGKFFVADVEGDIAGCASIVEYDGIVELRSLAVVERYKRKGLASRLIERCKSEAGAKGYELLYTMTQTPRPFEKHGFGPTDIPEEKLEDFCGPCPLYRNGCVEMPLAVRLG